MRLASVAVVVSIAGLSACGDSKTEEQSVLPGTTTILMEDNRFDPQGQQVERGVKLTWLNRDDVAHDVDFVSGGSFESDPVEQGETIEYTPTKTGTIEYVCSIHPNMTGTLAVE